MNNTHTITLNQNTHYLYDQVEHTHTYQYTNTYTHTHSVCYSLRTRILLGICKRAHDEPNKLKLKQDQQSSCVMCVSQASPHRCEMRICAVKVNWRRGGKLSVGYFWRTVALISLTGGIGRTGAWIVSANEENTRLVYLFGFKSNLIFLLTIISVLENSSVYLFV